jgi:hypothetical protein
MTEATEGVKRCPQCAFEMAEEAVICLECGFNTETRRRVTTVRTYETTSVDRTAWLMPGILCAIVLLVMVSIIIFLWLVMPGMMDEDSGIRFPLQVWGSIIAAFIGWYTGKFAYKRLIREPNPPEQVKG